MKNFKKIFIILSFLFLPILALAAPFSQTKELIGGVSTIVTLLKNLVAALALLFFFYGLAKFILNAGDDDKRRDGKKMMVWGVVALFVLVSIWGIVRLIGAETGVQPIQGPYTVPNSPSGGQSPSSLPSSFTSPPPVSPVSPFYIPPNSTYIPPQQNI